MVYEMQTYILENINYAKLDNFITFKGIFLNKIMASLYNLYTIFE